MSLPWYKWNVHDWQQSETRVALNLEQRGLYRELLDRCNVIGSIPSDQVLIQKLAGAEAEEFARAWPAVSAFFKQDTENPDRLLNPRALQTYLEHAELITRRREAGANGGRKSRPARKQSPSKTEAKLSTQDKQSPSKTEAKLSTQDKQSPSKTEAKLSTQDKQSPSKTEAKLSTQDKQSPSIKDKDKDQTPSKGGSDLNRRSEAPGAPHGARATLQELFREPADARLEPEHVQRLWAQILEHYPKPRQAKISAAERRFVEVLCGSADAAKTGAKMLREAKHLSKCPPDSQRFDVPSLFDFVDERWLDDFSHLAERGGHIPMAWE